MRVVLLAGLIVLMVAVPASAAIRPLAPRAPGGSAPALAGGSVVFSRESRSGAIVIRGLSFTTGRARQLARVPPQGDARSAQGGGEGTSAGGAGGWTLVGSSDGLALRLGDGDSTGNLFAGAVNGPLRRFTSRLADGRSVGSEPDLWAARGTTVVLEAVGGRPRRYRLRVFSGPGRSRILPLPRGADAEHADVSGSLAAVPVRSSSGLGAVAVIDLNTGRVVRTVSAGPLAGGFVDGVGLGPDGSVAVTADDDTVEGSVVGYAGSGEPALRVIHRAAGLEEVATAGGRVAVVAGAGSNIGFYGTRVIVLGPGPAGAKATTLMRGPPAAWIDGISFDGTRVAWGTGSCQVVADADPRSSAAVLPRGSCVRTEVGVTTRSPALRRGERSYPIRVECLAAPSGSCRIRLRARSFGGRFIARTEAGVPVGRQRTVRIRLRGRALRTARRIRDDVSFDYKVIDPGGRSFYDILP